MYKKANPSGRAAGEITAISGKKQAADKAIRLSPGWCDLLTIICPGLQYAGAARPFSGESRDEDCT